MFKDLFSLVRREQVSLFIGAGFSKEACAPSVYDLKKAILDEIHDTEKRESHKEDSLADLSNFFVNEVHLGSRNRLIRILHDAFDFKPKCMDDHKLLAKIPHFRRIFTTNYDTLLENSYEQNEVQVVRNDADCAYINKLFTVFKIHGDFTDPDSVVITADDYEKFFSANKNPIMRDLVKAEFATKNILFIGYSLEDDNILDIIRNVSEAQKSNQNEMFLIAPGISQAKQEELKKLKVHYFDTIANAFLKQLVDELREHISEDFRNKHISGETYTRFLNPYHVLPIVKTPVSGNNIIKKVESTTEKPLQRQIQMSVNAEIGEKLKNLDFEKDGEIISNKFFQKRPCFRITDNDLQKCRYLVNGVVLTNDIKEVIVSPIETKIELNFLIPSRNFFEMVAAKVYRLNDKAVRLDVDCDIYIMRIEIRTMTEDIITITFNFDFKKTYKNNNDAKKWIEIPCALFANENFFIQELSKRPLNLTSSSQSIKDNNFECFKQYYNDIERIEYALGKKFKVYNECTEQNCRIATYICSYLYREPLNIRCDSKDGLNFSTKIEEGGGELIETFKLNERISIIITEDKALNYELNDCIFNIPFEYKILNSCQITNIQKERNEQTYIYFHYDQPTYLLLFSSKSVLEEFPDIKPLDEIIKRIDYDN